MACVSRKQRELLSTRSATSGAINRMVTIGMETRRQRSVRLEIRRQRDGAIRDLAGADAKDHSGPRAPTADSAPVGLHRARMGTGNRKAWRKAEVRQRLREYLMQTTVSDLGVALREKKRLIAKPNASLRVDAENSIRSRASTSKETSS